MIQPFSILMTEMIPYLIGGLQELSAKNEQQATTIASLTEQLDTLTQQSTALLAWAQAQGFSA